MERPGKHKEGIRIIEKHSGEKNVQIFLYLARLFVLWFVLCIFFEGAMSVFSWDINAAEFYGAVLLCAAVCLFACSGSHKVWKISGLFVVYVLLMWKNRVILRTAVNHIANCFLVRRSEGIGQALYLYAEDIVTVRQLGMGILLLSVPVIILMTAIVITGRGRIIAGILLLLPIIAAAIAGTMPKESACWFLVFSGGLYFAASGYKDGRSIWRAVITAGFILLPAIGSAYFLENQIMESRKGNHEDYMKVRAYLKDEVLSSFTAEEGTIETEQSEGEKEETPQQGSSPLDFAGFESGSIDQPLHELSEFNPTDEARINIALDFEPQGTYYFRNGIGGTYTGQAWLSDGITDDTVYPVYTEFPGTLARLTELCGVVQGRPEEEVIRFIDEQLKTRAVYSYRPGATPQGEDFAEYFLFENQQGFCVHFATAATLMYRICQIPARYVSGYAVPPSAFVRQEDGTFRAQVTAQMGHAWCETPDGAGGWVVREHTPAYAGTDIVQPETEPRKQTESPAELAALEEKTHDGGLFVLWLILGTVLAVLAFIMQGKLRLKNRRRLFRMREKNKGIKSMYQNMHDMAVFMGMPNGDPLNRETLGRMEAVFDELPRLEWQWMYETVLKAMFTEWEIEKESTIRMYRNYRKLSSGLIKKMSFGKKILYRYIYCLG